MGYTLIAVETVRADGGASRTPQPLSAWTFHGERQVKDKKQLWLKFPKYGQFYSEATIIPFAVLQGNLLLLSVASSLFFLHKSCTD